MVRRMHHYARRARPDTLLFHTWREAAWLWRAIGRRVPGIVALTLMPDHLHLLSRDRVDQPLSNALRAYAIQRGRQSGWLGPTFRPGDPPTEVLGRLKEQRNERYISLNPCRAGLVDDPLAWPFSTHRDAVGLSLEPLRAPAQDPYRVHHYVSSDPSVQPDGSELPLNSVSRNREPEVEAICAAVSALTRRTLDQLEQRGFARNLALRAVSDLSTLSAPDVAGYFRVHRATVYRACQAARAQDVQLVERVLGDARFAALGDADLRPLLRRGRRGR